MNVKAFAIVFAACAVVAALAGAAAAFVLYGPMSPEEVLAASNTNVEAVTSTTFTMSMSMTAESDTMVMDAEGSVRLPGDFGMSGSMTAAGQTTRIEEILVDDVLYVRFGDDPQWYSTPMAVDIQDPTTSSDPSAYLTYAKAFAEIEDLGDQAVEGVDCQHYAIDVDEEALVALLQGELEGKDPAVIDSIGEVYEKADVQMEIWIAKDTQLPRRQVMDVTFRRPAEMRMHATIDYTGYNEPVTIQAPAGAVALPRIPAS